MAIAMPKRKSKIKGGEIISRILKAEGVEKVFGIIDGTYFGLYSTLGDHEIELITPRHETSAAFMAGAYARLTGKVGVCIASNGPGVANILPGVAVENAEGNRVLMITSSRREGIIYPERGGTYQYFPQVEVTRPMTKWACAVPSVDRLAEIMRRAFRRCFSGRPGVVHVDVPESIMNGKFEVDPGWFRLPEQSRMVEPLAPTDLQVRRAAELILGAERPIVHAGSGVIHARAFEALRDLATLLDVPITTSWGARAVIDERLGQSVSMVFVEAVNEARSQADVLLVLGSRLGETDWWSKPPYWGDPARQTTIQVDIDPEFIGNNRPVDLAVQADVGVFLERLTAELRRRRVELGHMADSRRAALVGLRKLCEARREKLDKQLDDDCVPMHPARVAGICQRVFDDDAIVVIDGGNTTIWTHFYHQVHTPNTIVGTPKMGMLGAGVPQALGAKAAHPDRQVYCVIGDGAMGMQPQEIETAVRNGLQVVYLVLCDKQWGMVKMNQQFALKPVKTLLLKSLGPDETINADLNEIQFDQLARAMGAHGERVADAEGLERAIERSLASGEVSVIHVDVDPVKHMWAPNLKDFKDMHQEPEG